MISIIKYDKYQHQDSIIVLLFCQSIPTTLISFIQLYATSSSLKFYRYPSKCRYKKCTVDFKSKKNQKNNGLSIKYSVVTVMILKERDELKINQFKYELLDMQR